MDYRTRNNRHWPCLLTYDLRYSGRFALNPLTIYKLYTPACYRRQPCRTKRKYIRHHVRTKAPQGWWAWSVRLGCFCSDPSLQARTNCICSTLSVPPTERAPRGLTLRGHVLDPKLANRLPYVTSGAAGFGWHPRCAQHQKALPPPRLNREVSPQHVPLYSAVD